MKKILFIISFALMLFANVFSQEIIIVDNESDSKINVLDTYKNYSALIKDFLDNGNIESLKKYSMESRNFYSPENYNSDLQPYLTGESIFYWNYLKPQIDNEDLVKVIDGNVISFWSYLVEKDSFQSKSIDVINFAISYSALLKENFKFDFPVSDFDKTKLNNTDTDYKIPFEKDINKAMYKAFSNAEGMQKRFEKNKIAAGTEIKLSDSAFVSLCNTPDLLYVIINYEAYSDLFNSFLKTLSTWINIPASELKKILTSSSLNYENDFIIFPDFIYEKVYPLISIEEKKDKVISLYEFSYYISNFALRNLQEGFDLNYIFSENELEILNSILNNKFSLFLIEDNSINNFSSKIKLFLDFDYFRNIIKLNSYLESGKDEKK